MSAHFLYGVWLAIMVLAADVCARVSDFKMAQIAACALIARSMLDERKQESTFAISRRSSTRSVWSSLKL